MNKNLNDINITKRKENRYKRLYNQILSHMDKTTDRISKMATIIAILHNKINYFFWTGFYFVDKENNQLVVGPYQGSLACLTLKYPHGVCWHSVINKKTTIVKNVHEFPDHIACDSRSKSEIVVPVFNPDNKIYAVFDVDSDKFNSFDEIDKKWLEKIIKDFLRI